MHIIVVKLGSDAVAFFELTTLLCMNDTVTHPNRVSLNLFFGMDDSGKAWLSGFRVNEPIFRGGSIHKDVETRMLINQQAQRCCLFLKRKYENSGWLQGCNLIVL